MVMAARALRAWTTTTSLILSRRFLLFVWSVLKALDDDELQVEQGGLVVAGIGE